MIYLITGKPGAGKTTYAKRLYKELTEDECKVTVIDGDEWREKHGNKDFSDEGRTKNLISAANAAAHLEKKGHIVIMAFVAPLREWRYEMRRRWIRSRVIYIPGGKLWEGTTYERPFDDELELITYKQFEDGINNSSKGTGNNG